MRADALRERLAGAGLLVSWPEAVPAELGAVATDHRRLAPGGVFVAYAGSTTDAHAFIEPAVAVGAALVVAERPVSAAVPVAVVNHGRWAAAAAAALQHGDPASALDLLAVTGTNGKTTSAHLLRHLFGDSAPAGSIGTLGAVDGEGRVLPGTDSLTTPGPVELMSTLAALRAAGVRTVAMEASSHSLDQDRLFGLSFKAAVFTNLTRDHLDYHKSMESYQAAKLKLATLLAPGGTAVTNADDPAWRQLAAGRVVSFGIEHEADVRASGISGDAGGMHFRLGYLGHQADVELPLLGRFNVENALGAAAVALALGRPLESVAARLAQTPQVPGRMERVADQPCTVLRDYAHTPDALQRALAAARPLTRGRLMVVFGCGGDRDRGKRPVMGRIAGRDADLAIVTSDNPRTEDPAAIIDQIEDGMGDTPHLRIVDRRQAIHRAVSIARPGDTILLAGKGHEDYQVVGREKLPFDEREVVADAIKAVTR